MFKLSRLAKRKPTWNDYFDVIVLQAESGLPRLLTNFDKKEESTYREAIEKSGKDFLYIKEDAYWIDGTYDETLSALWTNKDENLSDFWELLRSLKKEVDKNDS